MGCLLMKLDYAYSSKLRNRPSAFQLLQIYFSQFIQGIWGLPQDTNGKPFAGSVATLPMLSHRCFLPSAFQKYTQKFVTPARIYGSLGLMLSGSHISF